MREWEMLGWEVLKWEIPGPKEKAGPRFRILRAGYIRSLWLLPILQ